MALADLITPEFAAQALAAGGKTPSAAQETHLAAAIAAASRVVRRWCGDRDFTRATYTRDFTPDGDGRILLDQFPVNRVLRIAGGKTVALTVSAAAATNQRATVAYATAGDFDTGLAVTGLELTRVASGTTTAATLLYATYPTLAELAAAVGALATWSATLAPGFAAWPSSELLGGDVARGALAGAEFELFAEDLGGGLEPAEGILTVHGGGRPRFVQRGDSWSHDDDRAGPGPVRVTYDAGFDVVPSDVQEACAEAVADMLGALGIDARLQSETVGNRTQVYDRAFADYALSKPIMGKLAPWRVVRA